MDNDAKREGYVYNIRQAVVDGRIRDATHLGDVTVLLDALDEARGRLHAIDAAAHAAHAQAWHPADDGAFAAPFGTIRKCIGCDCLVAGGPTRCRRCADHVEINSP